MDKPEGLTIKERNKWYIKFKNQYTDLNKLSDDGILSLTELLSPLNLRKLMLIGVYIYMKVSRNKFIILVMLITSFLLRMIFV